MEGTSTKRQRWLPLVISAVLAVVLIGGASLISGWVYGGLLLAAWALLIYGLRPFVTQQSRLVMVSVTTLILGFVLWDYTARQPRIGIDSYQLRQVPSTVVPGSVELMLRNAGGSPADIVVVSVGHLVGRFSGADRSRSATVEADLTERLKRAQPLPPSGTLAVPSKETAAVSVEVPFSERAWVFDRGESTLLVAGRIRYRDRVFRREKQFCQFLNRQSNSWASCPFLNN
jgi:hypothetical protein